MEGEDVITPIANNLMRRLERGTEVSVDILAKSKIVNNMIKAALSAHNNASDEPISLTKEDKNAVAYYFAEKLIETANDHYNFEHREEEQL